MNTIPEPFGPTYPDLGASVAKYRRKARHSIYDLPRAERVAYADAIEKSVRAKQRSALLGASVVLEGPPKDIGAAIRAQHRAALSNCPSQIRKARTAREWQAMYDAAMREKNNRPQQCDRQNIAA